MRASPHRLRAVNPADIFKLRTKWNLIDIECVHARSACLPVDLIEIVMLPTPSNTGSISFAEFMEAIDEKRTSFTDFVFTLTSTLSAVR